MNTICDKKELANKAMNGDEEAMGLLILVSPSDEMGDMSEGDFAKHVAGDEYETPEDDVNKVMGLLMTAGHPENEAMEIASGIFDALGFYD